MKIIITTLFVLSAGFLPVSAQTFEWRLNNMTYSNVDPDGAGAAIGSTTFTLQIHAVSGSAAITGIGTGWAWQSSAAMLPTGAPCGSPSAAQPSNVTMSAAFAGFTYNFVDECSGTVNFSTGGQTFDRRASGTIDGSGASITIGTTWIDVFTVTLWAKNTSYPQAGYVVINSGDGGSPAAFGSYALSDVLANPYIVNSLTYTSPLPLGTNVVPVTFSSFSVSCNMQQAELLWSTENETNSSEFIIQKSNDGQNWINIGQVAAAGNSNTRRDYRFVYNNNGNAMYRVKLVDTQGRESYTEVRSTDCNLPTAISVYPVPARDILHVNIPSATAQRVSLVLTDASGRIIRSITGNLQEGMNPFSVNMTPFSPGYYVLRVMREGQSIDNIPVIKQ